MSNSHKQIGERNEKSTLVVNFEKGTRKQYHHMDEQVAELSQLKQNYKEVADIQEIQVKTVKTTS